MQSYSRPQKNKLPPNATYPASKRQKWPDQLQRSPSIRASFNQKHVFKWYEQHTQQYEGEEIFSPEWKDRLLSWGQDFSNLDSQQKEQLASYETNPQMLDLGLFFQFHPVAAFSLWHVLQACYELDMNICGSSGMAPEEIEMRRTIVGWRNLLVFQYLQSEEIMEMWQNKLQVVFSEAKQSKTKIEKEDVANRLYTLFQDVQSLENALSTLESVFEKSEDMESCQWMLALVREGVAGRCRVVNRIFDRAGLS